MMFISEYECATLIHRKVGTKTRILHCYTHITITISKASIKKKVSQLRSVSAKYVYSALIHSRNTIVILILFVTILWLWYMKLTHTSHSTALKWILIFNAFLYTIYEFFYSLIYAVKCHRRRTIDFI